VVARKDQSAAGPLLLAEKFQRAHQAAKPAEQRRAVLTNAVVGAPRLRRHLRPLARCGPLDEADTAARPPVVGVDCRSKAFQGAPNQSTPGNRARSQALTA